MSDSSLMREARELIEFYDANGWNWENALSFTLCREMFGVGFRCHPIEGYRCYEFPKKGRNGKSGDMESSH